MPVYFGDVSKSSTINSANLQEAMSIVVTMDDAKSTKDIIELLKKKNITVPIIVRAQTLEDLKEFEEFDYIEGIAEDILISSGMAEKILLRSGLSTSV